MESIVANVCENLIAGRTSEAEVFEGVHQAGMRLYDMLDRKLIKPQQIYLADMFEYFLCPRGSALEKKYGHGAIEKLMREGSVQIVSEAISGSGDFNTLFTKYLNSQFIPEYSSMIDDLAPLYTQLPSDDRIDFLGGLIDVDEPLYTAEGAPALGGDPREKYCEIENRKVTRLTGITEETILFDKTGGKILDKVRMRAQGMGRQKRRLIIYRIQDAAYTDNAFNLAANTTLKYGGSTGAMYSSDHSSVFDAQTNDNAGVGSVINETSFNTAYQLLGDMTDAWGRKLNLGGDTVLCARDNGFEAYKAANSTQVWDSSENGVNPVKGMGLINNVIVDAEVTVATWYFGNFRDQFVLTQVTAGPETNELGPDLKNGVVAQYRHMDHYGFGARDYRLVVKMAAS